MDYEFWKAAGIRALRTMAQSAIVLIPTGVVVTSIDWPVVVGVTVTEGLLSILTSIATGLPEVEA